MTLTHLLPSDRLSDEEYIAEVHRLMLRRLIGSRLLGPEDSWDAAQSASLKLWARVAQIRESYPEPAMYASAVTRSAAEDHRRRMRAQRGEGARVRRNTAGQAERRVEAIDDREIGLDLDLESIRQHRAEDSCVASMDDRNLAHRLLLTIGPSDRALLWQVHALGHSVTEAAPQLGLSRCQASRRLSAATRSLAAVA
jgi:RNA polymerase sigma factor (sigma-70 family)